MDIVDTSIRQVAQEEMAAAAQAKTLAAYEQGAEEIHSQMVEDVVVAEIKHVALAALAEAEQVPLADFRVACNNWLRLDNRPKCVPYLYRSDDHDIRSAHDYQPAF